MSRAREPLWYCHECHAEMRPLMIPDPHCASCNGTFVEKIESENDDPRAFQAAGPPFDFGSGDLPPGIDGFLSGLHEFLMSPSERQRRNQSQNLGENSSSGSGVRIEMRNTDGTRTRTFTFGGPSTLDGQSPLRTDRVPSLNEFVERGPQVEGTRLPTPLLAQYLSALLRQAPGGTGSFADMFGGPSGDYITNEADFNQILQQIMENSNAHRPVPATEKIIDDLPREVLEENSPLLQKDCAVCKEQFSVNAVDPDELVVVTLPCKHPFHQDCIIPWLKSSGTCPVCRHALVRQPDQEPAPGSETREEGSSPRLNESPELYNRLFSTIGSANSRDLTGSDSERSNTNFSRRRRRSPSPDPPGGWADQVD